MKIQLFTVNLLMLTSITFDFNNVFVNVEINIKINININAS